MFFSRFSSRSISMYAGGGRNIEISIKWQIVNYKLLLLSRKLFRYLHRPISSFLLVANFGTYLVKC